jgi:hypothetical protein
MVIANDPITQTSGAAGAVVRYPQRPQPTGHMPRTRTYITTSLILLGLTLASTSFINARPKSAAQTAMDACDRQLAADWTFCEGSKDSAIRRKCDENAEAKWKRCYEKAGWVFSVQGQPKMPNRRPPAMNPNNAGASSAGAEKGGTIRKPQPAGSAAATTRSGMQRTTPTPSPTPKKSTWVPQGPRQTGSHMR